MRSQKRGGPPALPPEEAAVTYSRIEDAEELPPLGEEPLADRFADGRREPTFTAMRVDPPRRRRERPARVDLDDFDDGAITLDRDTLDPEALGAAPPPRRSRRPGRRRSPVLRFVLLVGAIAVLGGIGVLGATAMKVLYGGPANVAAAPAPAADTPAGDTQGSGTQATATAADPTVAPVATPASVLPESGSAGPGVLAIPANDGGPIDMTPAAPASAAQSEAALSPVPAPRPKPEPAPVATDAKLRAATEAPPLPKVAPAALAPAALTPAAPAPVATASVAPEPVTGTDAQIDSALSDVDRLLAEKKAAPAATPAAPQMAEPDQTSALGQTGAPQPLNPALSPAQPLPADQSAALTITPPGVNDAPPLPQPATAPDPSIPVPPADIPNGTN
jgi:hypothetical protein